MTDLLIRNIDAHLKRQLEESARSHRRSLSEEARTLLKKALLEPPDKRKMGAALLELFPQKYQGDDLTFEVRGDVSRPPDFK
jgi:plasmid stability protein